MTHPHPHPHLHCTGEAGPVCVAAIAELLAVNALFRLRAAHGVRGLTGRHDDQRDGVYAS